MWGIFTSMNKITIKKIAKTLSVMSRFYYF